MAAALVSPLIKATIEKVGSYVGTQYNWRRDMKDDLTKLKETLVDIQCVVAVAERGQIMDEHQAELLRELKDAVYDADDVLDEFEYRDMEAGAMKARDAVRAITFSSLKFGKRLVGQDKLRSELDTVLRKLQNLNKRASRLIKVVGNQKTPSENVEIRPGRYTSCIPSSTRIFGRDEVKEKIVRLLVESTSEHEFSDWKPIPVVPIVIVGIGGVGKTTLAQSIYNDERIADHFNLKMWVCVSNRSHDVTLANAMLGSASSTSDFNTLQNELQAKVKSKIFLLVLDDVWMDEKLTENKQLWEKLLAPLKAGAKGSKILVTTRMKNVADMFDDKNPIFLEGLEKDGYWQLFASCAFCNKNPNDHPELKQIAWKIVERLKGSPLAAKTVGSMLQSMFNIEEWKKILETRVFDDIKNVLNLSYEHLPNHLKHCFAYCSIFPKDWKFNRQKLAFLWVAQGYVQRHEGDIRTEENIGIVYFDELVSRSFFQMVEKDSSISYVMHDLIHDLAEDVSIHECVRINCGEQRSIGRSIRHIGVDLNGENINYGWSQLEEMRNRMNLRTLIFVNSFHESLILPSWFREVRRLRVLGFEECRVTNDEWKGFDIGHLVHLRYLDLSLHYLDISAECLSGLFHLKVVFSDRTLIHSKSLVELSAFGKLTHIFGTLEFVVGKKRGVRDLKVKKLLHGGGLTIRNLENVRSEVEAAEVGLEHHDFIEHLYLIWGDSKRRFGRHDSKEKILDALKPHPNLKNLKIENFGGSRCPRWLEPNSLIHLQSICLDGCKGFKVMPPLGHLPCLVDLELWWMDSVERVGREFYGHGSHGVKGFPSLETLLFIGMPAWVEWSAPEFPVFPRLRQLRVRNCPELKRFPSFPSAVEEPVTARGMSPLVTLQKLNIYNCREELFASMIPDDDNEEDRGILLPSLASLTIDNCPITTRSLSRCLQGLSSLSELRIQSCDDLTSLPSAEVLHRLAALQEMSIWNCKELASLGGLHALPSLQTLYATHFPKLKSLPEEDEEGCSILPPSLVSLEIRGCGVTDRCLSRCLQGLSFLSKLNIRFCDDLTSLPSAEVLHRLAALQEMSIWNCEELVSLGGLHALPSLQTLDACGCPKLESLPKEGLPPSVMNVQLEGCHPALKKQMHEKEGPEWDKISCHPSLQLLGSFS